MKTEEKKRILYQKGGFHVQPETFGRRKSKGFAVYQRGIVCAVRVANIGYSGKKGLQRAKEECDKRHLKHQTQNEEKESEGVEDESPIWDYLEIED